jgi:predicted nuclease of predicted toxin-antitoxin system
MSSTPSFLLDENLPSKLAKRFVQAGYVATSVALAGLTGQSDQVIFRYARSHVLSLLTADTDFLRTSDFPPPHAGIIVVTFPPRTRIAGIVATLLAALPEIASIDLTDHVYILEAGQLRIHQ